jgi:hypothetical protein
MFNTSNYELSYETVTNEEIFMKTRTSLSVTQLVRWESHLDHGEVFWHKTWIGNRRL